MVVVVAYLVTFYLMLQEIENYGAEMRSTPNLFYKSSKFERSQPTQRYSSAAGIVHGGRTEIRIVHG